MQVESHLLDDILSALRVDSSALFVFDFKGQWATNVSDAPVPISWTLVEGAAWVVPPTGEPVRFLRGDTFLFPRGIRNRDYVLASSPALDPVPARELWRNVDLEGFEPGHTSPRPIHVRWGQTGELTRVISTAFSFDDRQIGPLVAALPELIVVRAEEGEARFIDTVLNHTLYDEDSERPGFAALVTQAVQMLLVRMVRRYALSLEGNELGWLAGLRDPRLARSLAAIHRRPGHDWTVAELARIAGMSRSLFAEQFLERVGQTPIKYLRAWRIHLARTALASGEGNVATVAHELGYQSEAAFRGAFRRVTGQAPGAFRRETKPR